MATFADTAHAWFRQSFSTGLARLSPAIERVRATSHIRSIRMAGLAAAALVVGTWADSGAMDRAKRDWERNHHPSAKFVSQTLKSVSLNAVTNSLEIHKLIRDLPTLTSAEGELWFSAPTHTVVLSGETPTVWTGHATIWGAKKTRPAWESMGSGWPGLAQTIAEVEKAAMSLPPARKAERTGTETDPRQLRY